MTKSHKSQSLLSYLQEMGAPVPGVEFEMGSGSDDGTGGFLESGIMRKMAQQGMLPSLDADMRWLDAAIAGNPAKKNQR